MKVLLVFPPQWVPYGPYLSLPSLAAFLRAGGISVIQKDLNIESYDFMLSRQYLKKIAQILNRQFNTLQLLDELTITQQEYYNDLFIAKHLSRKLVNQVDKAKQVYRDKTDFYDLERLASAKKVIDSALAVISLAHYPTTYTMASFEMQDGQNSLDDIDSASTNLKENPFINFYKSDFINFAHEQKPDVIAISIISSTQLIPGMTLCRMLKDSGIKSHIVVGGATITYLKDALSNLGSRFNKYFDSAIFYEGETPLIELVRCLEVNGDLKKVPNLMYSENGHVVINDTEPAQDINLLPTPDFDGLPLTLYFSPDLVLPLLHSRGCYWSKCAFCSHGLIYNGHFRLRTTQKVVDDIVALSAKYRTRNFAFSDEGISPHALKSLSGKLIEDNVKIRYSTGARFEKQFSRLLCDQLACSGLKIIYFGLESGCDRILNHMRKGISIEQVFEVCQNVHSAGIWNHLFIFYGFPTETLNEAEQTSSFLRANKGVIRSFSGGNFVLSKGSDVANHPEEYGACKRQADNGEFQVTFDYETVTGITQREAQEISEKAVRSIYQEYASNAVISTLGQDNLLQYLAHYEITDPFLDSLSIGKRMPEKSSLSSNEDVSGQSKPIVNNRIVCDTIRYNILDIRKHILLDRKSNVLPKLTSLIYDLETGVVKEITLSAKEILDECDGRTNVIHISKKLAGKYRRDLVSIEADCSSFLKEMIAQNVVSLIR
jgi:anaerobic magnesium-protoporphyrin IX monomethyl ester cyclase